MTREKALRQRCHARTPPSARMCPNMPHDATKLDMPYIIDEKVAAALTQSGRGKWGESRERADAAAYNDACNDERTVLLALPQAHRR